jgi:thymidylate kinase
MTDRAAALAAFTAWLDLLKSSGAPLVQLRPRSMDAVGAFEGDFDYIADPDAFVDMIEAAREVCIDHGVAIEVKQDAAHKRVLRFWADPPSRSRITVELWPHAELRLGDGRVGAVQWAELTPIWEAEGRIPDAVLGLIYATHLHHKREDLRNVEVRHRLGLLEASLNKAGDEPARAVIAGLRSGEMCPKDASRASLAALQDWGIEARVLPFGRVRRLGSRVSARLPSRSRRRARIVPILGPDGSGKTTMISALQQSHAGKTRYTHFVFKHLFRRSFVFRVLYRLAARRAKADGLPMGPVKNGVDEGHPHLLMLLCLARWPVVRAKLIRAEGPQGTVLVDRWFWDYLLRPRDPDFGAAHIPATRVYRRLIPMTDRAVVLVCPPAMLVARKQDLSEHAIEAIYRLYSDQIAASRSGSVLLLPTVVSPERSAAHLVSYIS